MTPTPGESHRRGGDGGGGGGGGGALEHAARSTCVGLVLTAALGALAGLALAPFAELLLWPSSEMASRGVLKVASGAAFAMRRMVERDLDERMRGHCGAATRDDDTMSAAAAIMARVAAATHGASATPSPPRTTAPRDSRRRFW